MISPKLMAVVSLFASCAFVLGGVIRETITDGEFAIWFLGLLILEVLLTTREKKSGDNKQ